MEQTNLISYILIISIFMLVMGAGMIGIWLMDIWKGKFSAMGNFFVWTNDGGDLMWPHIIAEMLTGSLLLCGGLAFMAESVWAKPLSLVALGALCYTSLNSLSWVFANKTRLPYGVPMLVGLAGSIIAIVVLLVS